MSEPKIRLADLTTPQRRMLTFLDDGQNDEDAVGREIEEIAERRGTFAVADRLVEMGLAERLAGPRVGGGVSAWYRLTGAGRRVRDQGET